MDFFKLHELKLFLIKKMNWKEDDAVKMEKGEWRGYGVSRVSDEMVWREVNAPITIDIKDFFNIFF